MGVSVPLRSRPAHERTPERSDACGLGHWSRSIWTNAGIGLLSEHLLLCGQAEPRRRKVKRMRRLLAPRMRRLLALAVCAVALAVPAAAFAAPPILQSVNFDQSSKVLTVSWSLPPGVQSRVLEVNTNPALDSEGYFLFGASNGYYGPKIIFELPEPTATSWVDSYSDLPAGHYYVHIAGLDTTCSSCASPEWTELGTFDVSPPPPPAPRCVVPKVTGKSLRTARTKLGASHCRTGRVGYRHSKVRRGLVSWQSRRAGARLPSGSRVSLLVSLGR